MPVMQQAAGLVRERQEPLRRQYQLAPDAAWITDHARASCVDDNDPFHGYVAAAGVADDLNWDFGIHRAIGGMHDAPNPGDLLCAALAACQLATLRMIADRLGIRLEKIIVDVTAHVDVRGTLQVAEVPIGFQHLECVVRFRTSGDTHPELLSALKKNAERSCVILQTLQQGTKISNRYLANLASD